MTRYFALFDGAGLPERMWTDEVRDPDDNPAGTVDLSAEQHAEIADNQGLRRWDGKGLVAYQPPAPAPKPPEAYGDDLIAALSDAELTAMSGGTMRDQRMLSAQRSPFAATDDIIVRLAAVMKIDPGAWLARVPG